MTTASNEAVPVMPDIRAVQREARRITAILEWPSHLIAAVLFTVGTGLWLGGLYAGKSASIIQISFVLYIAIMWIYRKRIPRSFLGTQTPMIVRKKSYGPEDLLFVTGLVVGAVLGFASTKLFDKQGEDVGTVLMFSCFLGGGIAATIFAWRRTHLWEFILSLFLQIVMLGVLQTFRAIDSSAIWLFLPLAIFHSYVFAISFYLRWRRWVKSLPETVKTEEA